MNNKKKRGFTLIELLVVIAVIGILASIVVLTLHSTNAKARDGSRRVALKQLKTALELYYFDNNGKYPSTNSNWWGVSINGGSRTTSGIDAYIPGLEPYVSDLPVDERGDTSGWSGYLYRSDGINYKLLSHENGPESFPSIDQPLYDPVRPTWAWMVCSGEPACSAW